MSVEFTNLYYSFLTLICLILSFNTYILCSHKDKYCELLNDRDCALVIACFDNV